MKKRFLISGLFLTGGVVTILLILALQSFGNALAGMSAGPVSRPASDAIATWLFCAYFFVSAIAIALTNDKKTLSLMAALAHFLVFIFFCLICAVGISKKGFAGFLPGAITLAIIVLAYLLPWLILWGLIIKKAPYAIKASENLINHEQKIHHNQIKPKY